MNGRRLSDKIRSENAGLWDAMQAHRFVAEIESDRLPDEVFKSYLVYECDFVETAMLIFGVGSHLEVRNRHRCPQEAVNVIMSGGFLRLDGVAEWRSCLSPLRKKYSRHRKPASALRRRILK
jgi:hypothetical protein